MSKVQPAPAKSAPDPSIWVDLHGNYLYRYANFRLRDQTQAEDVVQETFVCMRCTRYLKQLKLMSAAVRARSASC